MAKPDRTSAAEALQELRQAISQFQAEFEGLAEEVTEIAPDVFEEFARFRDSMVLQERSAEAYDAILAMLPAGPERG